MLARRRMLPSALVLALSLPWLATSSAAPTADDQNKALATDLFDKGLNKMEQGKCDQQPIGDLAACEEARESFRRSYEIYPAGLGALRNLAYVERGLLLYASSARHFRELERRAPTDPNPKRHVWAEFARKELVIIEPLVPHLTVQPPSVRPAGLTISLDGAPLPEAVWGASIDVDPGAHTLHAEATHRAPFEAKISIAEKESKVVEVAFADSDGPPPKPVIAKKEDSSTPSRTLPLVVAGAGVVVTGVGLLFGLSAINHRKDACGDGNLCEPQKLADARSAASTSNIVTGVGAALLVGGVVWFLLTPSRPEAPAASAIRVMPFASSQSAGLAAAGRF